MRLSMLLTVLMIGFFLTGCAQPQATVPQTPVPVDPSDTAVQPAASPQTPLVQATPLASDLDIPALQLGQAAPTAAPTPEKAGFFANQPTRILIDAITLDQPLVPVGLDDTNVPIVPKHDVGWYYYSAQPGTGDNVVLWGHVLRFRDAPDVPAPFARLRDVQIGDRITVYAANGTAHQYIVNDLIWATPDQVEYILPQGQEMLTLVSCIGDQVIVNDSVELTHRLITVAFPAES